MAEPSRPIGELIPYLRLLVDGELVRNKETAGATQNALDFQWAELSSRAKVVALTARGRNMLERFLDNQWPAWPLCLAKLKNQELPVTCEGVKELERRKRARAVSLPSRAHHKTLAAALGAHSKTGLGQGLRTLLPDTEATTDQVLRLRTNKGLVVQGPEGEVVCDVLMGVLGEVILPERAFLDGLSLAGSLPTAVLTVENRGSFVDLPPVPYGTLVIHVPGNDTPLGIRFLNLLPRDIRHVHFGDLDFKGLAIAKNLNQNCPQETHLFVPPFWEENVDILSGFKEWPEEQIPFAEKSPLLARLRKEGRWLEQERIAFDPRLQTALRAELTKV